MKLRLPSLNCGRGIDLGRVGDFFFDNYCPTPIDELISVPNNNPFDDFGDVVGCPDRQGEQDFMLRDTDRCGVNVGRSDLNVRYQTGNDQNS
jgi:hypothetical protein